MPRALAHGFTLVELLVALAIFLTIMAIVALFFTSAIRTSKQGMQNQEAFELARGAMRLIERDLSRAFTNRDHGDVYSFYGTPIGFTFVGMIPTDGGSDSYNLGRVTYVIYHDTLDQAANAGNVYESVDGALVPTYSLLRFVEPGVDNLDAFSIPWGSSADFDGMGTFSFEQVAEQIAADVGCPDAACEEIAMQTARRDIWIRMLAGGDEEVDSAWGENADIDLGDPLDYALADNIRYLAYAQTLCGATEQELETQMSQLGISAIDFDDELFRVDDDTICVRPLTDVFSIFPGAVPTYGQTWTADIEIENAPRPFFTYWDMGMVRNNVTFASERADKVVPIAHQFWNDVRNVAQDGLDTDGDGLIDEADEGLYGINVGSPMDARLPLAVTVDFTLFFRSPYLGAPDFNQRFTQRIDLPTGYRRLINTTAPQNP